MEAAILYTDCTVLLDLDNGLEVKKVIGRVRTG